MLPTPAFWLLLFVVSLSFRPRCVSTAPFLLCLQFASANNNGSKEPVEKEAVCHAHALQHAPPRPLASALKVAVSSFHCPSHIWIRLPLFGARSFPSFADRERLRQLLLSCSSTASLPWIAVFAAVIAVALPSCLNSDFALPSLQLLRPHRESVTLLPLPLTLDS